MAERPKQERSKTRYQVFRVRIETGQANEIWAPVSVTEAHNGGAAITAVAAEPGDYRAVPLTNITEQAMGYPPPEPAKLVPVSEVPSPAEQIEDALESADPPHSAAGGSLRAVEAPADEQVSL